MTEQEMRERLENGLCIKCGKPISDKRGICQECYDSLPENYKAYIGALWLIFNIKGRNND